jgi:hypothetical protein
MEFLEFLAQWGGEILLALAAAGITAYLKNESNTLKKKLQFYEDAKKAEEQQKTEHIIEEKLEPIYEELEALRTYIRETESIEKVHMSLIIASYRFRLIQLCKEFIKQGYLTQAQYDQLSEFYRVYVGLGGNGQAEDYYKRTMKLPIHCAED